MTDPRLPPDEGDELRALQGRVSALERAQGLKSSSIRGGQIIILDAAGNEVARIGDLGDGTEGLRVRMGSDPTSSHLLVNGDGIVLPLLPHPWRPESLEPFAVTSATFVSCWRLRPQLCAGPTLEFSVLIGQPAGTECELRLFKNGTTAIGSPFAVTATSKTCFFKGDHGVPVRTGSGANIALECRRTAGTGTVTVCWPSEGAIGGPLGGGAPVGWS